MLLPLRTDRPRIRPAYLTVTLIAVNVLIYVYGFFLAPYPLTLQHDGMTVTVDAPRLVFEYGLWGSHPTALAFFTHMFIHSGILHLVGNMLFLWIFGSLMEDAIRPWGLAAVYFGGGVLAALSHIGITHAMGGNLDVPMVGASGAIAAIMGLFMLRFYKTRVQIFYWLGLIRVGTAWIASVWVLLIWVGLEIVEGLLSSGQGVAHWAHIGGFFAGALAAPFLGSVTAAKREYFSEDPATNVEYIRRSEQAAAAAKALRADPGNAYQMWRVARACAHAGDEPGAVRNFRESAASFAMRGMIEQALEVYLEMIQFDESAVLPAAAQLKMAQVLEPTHLPQAVAAYERLAEYYPTLPETEQALVRLAVIYQRIMERPYESLRCLNVLLERFPYGQSAAWARQARDYLRG